MRTEKDPRLNPHPWPGQLKKVAKALIEQVLVKIELVCGGLVLKIASDEQPLHASKYSVNYLVQIKG